MRRVLMGSLLSMLALGGCRNDGVAVVDPPAAPEALSASYYAGSVTVSWELGPSWDGEAFRVYSRRITDADFFFIAEVTSCIDGFCTYEDLNVTAGETYEYSVSAFSTASGLETEGDFTVEVFVPSPTPPPVPDGPLVIALDNSLFLTWGAASRGAADFSFYRVYQADGPDDFLLGETDSEGFVDLLAGNGITYSYFVTAVDTDGHESTGSGIASGTPRPDYHGEIVYSYFDVPTASGFRFEEDEATDPIRDGDDAASHFRFEADVDGTFWIVPLGATEVRDMGATTALKCGVGADATCVDVPVAPLSGYTAVAVQMFAGTSYVMKAMGDDGLTHYGVIRVEHLGADQNGDLMIFDWAYQLQAGSPDLIIVR